VAEIGPGRQGGVARGPAVFLLHPPQSRPKLPRPGKAGSAGSGTEASRTSTFVPAGGRVWGRGRCCGIKDRLRLQRDSWNSRKWASRAVLTARGSLIMKRVEASSRGIHQWGPVQFAPEPEDLHRQPGCQATASSDYRRNWAEEIWPDCRLERSLSGADAA
jgi:hypothetical protein